MPHSAQNRSFWRRAPKPISWLGTEKENLAAQQKHAFTNQKKCTTTQNKQKTKARLSRLLRHPARKWRGLFWFQRFLNVTYLLTQILTHLLTAPDSHLYVIFAVVNKLLTPIAVNI